jgi:transcriptional regulator with XRE-family HTH domain
MSLGQAGFGARLRALRVARQLSQGELARHIGRHQTSIGPYERGEYAPPRDIVERLASALETTPEYLLFGRDPRRISLPVTGHAGAAAIVAEPPERPAHIRLADERLEVVRVGDDTMAPTLRAGQLAIIGAAAVPPAQCLGREALVELADGRRLIRRLLPAATADRFDLGCPAGPTLRHVDVVRARPLLGALWPEALAGEG